MCKNNSSAEAEEKARLHSTNVRNVSNNVSSNNVRNSSDCNDHCNDLDDTKNKNGKAANKAIAVDNSNIGVGVDIDVDYNKYRRGDSNKKKNEHNNENTNDEKNDVHNRAAIACTKTKDQSHRIPSYNDTYGGNNCSTFDMSQQSQDSGNHSSTSDVSMSISGDDDVHTRSTRSRTHAQSSMSSSSVLRYVESISGRSDAKPLVVSTKTSDYGDVSADGGLDDNMTDRFTSPSNQRKSTTTKSIDEKLQAPNDRILTRKHKGSSDGDTGNEFSLYSCSLPSPSVATTSAPTADAKTNIAAGGDKSKNSSACDSSGSDDKMNMLIRLATSPSPTSTPRNSPHVSPASSAYPAITSNPAHSSEHAHTRVQTLLRPQQHSPNDSRQHAPADLHRRLQHLHHQRQQQFHLHFQHRLPYPYSHIQGHTQGHAYSRPPITHAHMPGISRSPLMYGTHTRPYPGIFANTGTALCAASIAATTAAAVAHLSQHYDANRDATFSDAAVPPPAARAAGDRDYNNDCSGQAYIDFALEGVRGKKKRVKKGRERDRKMKAKVTTKVSVEKRECTEGERKKRKKHKSSNKLAKEKEADTKCGEEKKTPKSVDNNHSSYANDVQEQGKEKHAQKKYSTDAKDEMDDEDGNDNSTSLSGSATSSSDGDNGLNTTFGISSSGSSDEVNMSFCAHIITLDLHVHAPLFS